MQYISHKVLPECYALLMGKILFIWVGKSFVALRLGITDTAELEARVDQPELVSGCNLRHA